MNIFLHDNDRNRKIGPKNAASEKYELRQRPPAYVAAVAKNPKKEYFCIGGGDRKELKKTYSLQ